ncbi:MAG: hypothetical protein Q9216_001214 [Gyalolechia sp. 2 TL-2023]
MPFRDKVKKAFGKPSEGPLETNTDVSQVQSKISSRKSKKQKVEYPDNVYRPGEIPESKYKGPYNKAHQQKLHAFSFGTAFQGRRKSNQSSQSLYSPMGSRLPSRVGSFMSRRSFGPKSRQQSRVEDTLMENNEADDTVENGKFIIPPSLEPVKLNSRVKVGMSRQHAEEEAPRLRKRGERRPPVQESLNKHGVHSSGTHESEMVNDFGNHTTADMTYVNGYDQDNVTGSNHMDGLEPIKTLTNDYHHQASFGQPFSADDLVRAMTQSTLKPSAMQA